jgi:hypothetical protein
MNIKDKITFPLILMCFLACNAKAPDRWKMIESDRVSIFCKECKQNDIKAIKESANKHIASLDSLFSIKLNQANIYLYSDRKSFDGVLSKIKQVNNYKSPTWLVASVAKNNDLAVLMPSSWSTYSPSKNIASLDSLIKHEVVHMFHNQILLKHSNKTLHDLKGINWFTEGIATLLAMQYENRYLEISKMIVDMELKYKSINKMMSRFKNRYRISCFFVKFIHDIYGQSTTFELLSANNMDDLLRTLNTNERNLIEKFINYSSNYYQKHSTIETS